MKWRWLLAAVVVIAYNTWVLAPVLNPNPQALFGYLSELAATDQPNHWFFRAGDLIASAAIIAIAVLGWPRWDAWLGPWKKLLVGSMGAVALFTIIDVIFAMPCAATFDEACRAPEQAEPFAVTTLMHAIASALVGISIVVSIVAVYLGRRGDGDPQQAQRVMVVGLAIGGLMVGTILVHYMVGIGHGIFQMVQVVLTSLWFGWLAVSLVHTGGDEFPSRTLRD